MLAPLLSVLSAIALIAAGGYAGAASSPCAPLFETTTPEFQTSEGYRISLLKRAKQLLNLSRTARMKYTIDFQLQLERRGEVSRTRIASEMESSPTLSRLEMQPARASSHTVLPPSIRPETMELMQDLRADLPSVAAKMETDPYFIWLKHNALRYQASQKDDLRNVSGALKPPFDQANPIALFITYRKEGMSPDMSLIRLMRAMDPVLSASAVHAASGAMFYTGLEGVLVDKVIANLETRSTNPERDIWLLMPTYADGVRSLRKLLDEQVAKFGKLFPRAAYERMLLDAHHQTPEFFIISEYRARRYSGASELATLELFEPKLRTIRTRLGLSEEFPLNRLYDVIDRAYTLQGLSSYEAILADVFDPKAGATIRELRFMVELAEGISTNPKADAYLRSLVEPY